jgi:hypothetical protein
MANAIRERTVVAQRITAGPQILDVVTTGMYNDPLMVIREYVQNAADSLDCAIANGDLTAKAARIDICLDGADRRLTIADNGVGMRRSQALEILCSIGVSTKLQNVNRGFRGIGRLGGLGYCDAVQFETRSKGERQVTTVVWHANELKSVLVQSRDRQDLDWVVKRCVTISTRDPLKNDPESFFRVTLNNVACFHKDELMNIPTLREYLSKVAPVPFAAEFPYAQDINRHLRSVSGYRAYNVFVNDKRVVRPHETEVKLGINQLDAISDVKCFVLHDRERTKEIGRGWYAILDHVASLPASIHMRGVWVRQGNIGVGDEHFLAEAFTERRFAVWHIGEIHLSYDLRANARRDGFEHNSDHEAFLEQACLLGGHLSKLCRHSSSERSNRQQLGRIKERLEVLGKVALVADETQLAELLQEEEDLLDRLKRLGGRAPRINGRTKARLLPDVLDGRHLRSLTKKDLLVDVGCRLAKELNDSAVTARVLERILEPYLTVGTSRSAIK